MTDDTAVLLTSWDLALHDKADTTRKLYREVLVAFARQLPEGKGLLEVTRRDCQAYFASMKAQGRAQATLRSRWIALRSFYGWAADEDEIVDNPMLGIKVERANPPPTVMPDEDDLRLLLKSLHGKGFAERRDLAMLRTALATGARVSEVCNIDVADVDLANRVVVIRKGKGGRSRVARVDPETGAAIDRYLRARARHRLAALPELFITRFGPIHRQGAAAMLTRRCQEAGVAHMHWHSFRHRFAHEFLSRGGDEGALAALGGWTDASVMRRYGAQLATDRALTTYDDVGGVLSPRRGRP